MYTCSNLIMEYAQSGSTATLYFHGLTHAFGQPHLPIQYSNEAGEHELRLGKTFATLTTTCPEDSIRETLNHELLLLSPTPVQAGGHKYTCGSLSGGRWCWNNVFSVRRQSGVSLWSHCGHYWHYQPLGSFATRRPNRFYCSLGVKWVGPSGWNFG